MQSHATNAFGRPVKLANPHRIGLYAYFGLEGLGAFDEQAEHLEWLELQASKKGTLPALCSSRCEVPAAPGTRCVHDCPSVLDAAGVRR